MRRLGVRALIFLPWVALTLACILVFLAVAPTITDQLVAVSILVIAASIPTAYVISDLIVRALHDLRSETARLARLRSSPIDPYTIAEIHALRTAITSATDELHQRVNEADASTARLRAVLESLTEGVIQLTANERFVNANAAARRMFHLPGNVEGQAVAALIRKGELRTALQKAASGDSLDATEITVDDRQLLLLPRRLRFSTGDEIPGVVVGIVDLTELRRLETVRRDFVANVSHEFKTPLTSIRGYTETLIHDDLSREQQHQFLSVVKNNAERLQHLVDDLLDLSRLQSGGWQPQTQTVDVRALTKDVWLSLDAPDQKSVRFAIQGPEQALVAADPSGLRQVLSNVLENAVRYSPPNGIINVEIAELMTGTEIRISDHGAGIPREALPRIFERFYRADPARGRDEGGTGLGLSIVKHLIERMNGEVSAQSEVGKGTTIKLVLPAAPK